MIIKNPPRIQSIDALRGIALAGIAICHLTENFIGAPFPEEFDMAVHPSVIDTIVDGLIFFLLRGKFIALFSFLFGLSFFIQMNKSAESGTNFGGRFLWRLIILLCIGYVHSLFYRGDILTIYALLGIFLIPFYKINTKWIIVFASLLFLGLGRAIVFSITHGDSIWGGPTNIDSNATWLIDYYGTLKNGSLFDVFRANAIDGHRDKWDFQFGFFGRGYFTFAFFLIGLYAGRSNFFKNFSKEKARIKRLLIWSIIVLIVALILTAVFFSSLGESPSLDNWTAMAGLTAMDIANTAMTFIYIAVFAILYQKERTGEWLTHFAPYGRMALTNYVVQSIIGTGLLYGWGLGLIGELRQLYTFGLSFLVIIIQVRFSRLWLSKFRYGPIEWLWRSLTFLKFFPLRNTL